MLYDQTQPPVLVFTVYRPAKQCPVFLDEFTEMLSIVRANYDNNMVVGHLIYIHVDSLADSDHSCIFFSVFLASPSNVSEQIVRKRLTFYL